MYVPACLHACVHVDPPTHTGDVLRHPRPRPGYPGSTCMHAYMPAHARARAHTHTRTHARTHARTHVGMQWTVSCGRKRRSARRHGSSAQRGFRHMDIYLCFDNAYRHTHVCTLPLLPLLFCLLLGKFKLHSFVASAWTVAFAWQRLAPYPTVSTLTSVDHHHICVMYCLG